MPPRRKKIICEIGDVFAVPLNDGQFSTGQILTYRMKNVAGVALYDERLNTIDNIQIGTLCINKNLISLIETTRELIDNGTWKILGNKNINIPKERFPNEEFRGRNWAGSITRGAGNVWEFLNAFYALGPWDIYFDPDYLNNYLYDLSKKPKNLILTKNA